MFKLCMKQCSKLQIIRVTQIKTSEIVLHPCKNDRKTDRQIKKEKKKAREKGRKEGEEKKVANSGKAVEETGFLQPLGGNTDWCLSMKKRRRNKISIRVSLLASGDECSVLRTSGLP